MLQNTGWRGDPRRHGGPDRPLPHHHHDAGHGDPRMHAFARQHHRGDFGRGPEFGPFGPGFGRMFARGFARAFGAAPVRRGDVRSAILKLLAEEPMHGYQIIQQLGERSRGMWRPSAGSVYPTLQQLEDEGLLRGEERDGRKVYSLTDAGKSAAAELGERAPWDQPTDTDAADLHDLIRQLLAATAQVARIGSPAAVAQARTVLADARRSLYRILAEDEGATEMPEEPAATPDED